MQGGGVSGIGENVGAEENRDGVDRNGLGVALASIGLRMEFTTSTTLRLRMLAMLRMMMMMILQEMP